MRTVLVEHICELGAAGAHAELSALINGPHTVAFSHELALRELTGGGTDFNVHDRSHEVIPHILREFQPFRNQPGVAEKERKEGKRPRNPDGWARSLEILLTRYRPLAKEWLLTETQIHPMTKEPIEAPVQSILHRAAATSRIDVMEVAANFAPHAEGRSIRVSDGLQELVSVPHGIALLDLLVNHKKIKLVADPRYPDTWFDRLALTAITRENFEMVRALARHGVDFSKPLAKQHGFYWGQEDAPQAGRPFYTDSGCDRFFPVFMSRSLAMVELLESLGADVKATSPIVREGENALFFALRMDVPELLRDLIDRRGFDVNVQNDQGYTPLHWAISSGTTKQAEYLISKGALPTIRNDLGATPLERIFVVNQSTTKLKLLLKHGVDLFGRDFAGKSYVGSVKLPKDVQLVGQMLLDAIRSQESQKELGLPVAEMVASEVVSDFLVSAIACKQADIVIEVMRTNGWDPQVLGHSGKSPVHELIAATGKRGALGAKNDHHAIVCLELAISKGMDLNFRDASGLTPLMAALKPQNSKALSWLVQKGADIDARTLSGRDMMSLTKDKTMKAILKSEATARAIQAAVDGGVAAEAGAVDAVPVRKRQTMTPL